MIVEESLLKKTLGIIGIPINLFNLKIMDVKITQDLENLTDSEKKELEETLKKDLEKLIPKN